MISPESEEILRRLREGFARPEVAETHLERTMDDLDTREFVKHFLTPYNPEDSLEYMARELVTLKQGEELEANCGAVQELISRPDLRKAVERFVISDYELNNLVRKREELIGPLGLGEYIAYLSRKKLLKLIKTDYLLLSSYKNAVEKTQEIESNARLLAEIKEFGSEVAQDENFQTARGMVETMENFGEAKLSIRYDYFDEVKELRHLRFDPKERWREMLGWYLHTVGARLEELSSLGLAYIIPRRRERFYAGALEFLIEKNLPLIQGMLEYRKKMDFFLGATRYVEKMESEGLPLTYPRFTENQVLEIKELYNPILLLQREIREGRDIVPNNVESNPEESMTVITGPNNTGKTVYVKSIGLAYALAQNGFPITAREAQLTELDGLHTHFVHPEDIRLGEGAYLDELRRIKELFQKATARSLIIVDEPIRGTAPEDAEAMTLRFVKGFLELKATTFLTTHLHLVSREVEDWDGVRNLQTEVELEGDEIKPTYKIKLGKAGRSYGVEIAEKFGLGEDDIQRMVGGKPES